MKRLIPIAVFISLVFLSCTKDGPTGPAGPAGPNGAAGPSGPSGPAGPAGTANVIYSEWLDVTYTPVIDNGDTLGFTATIPAPKLDNAMLTNGEIKVYINVGTATSPSVWALPLTDLIVYGLQIFPSFETGVINLVASVNIGTVTTAGVKSQQYRYILIPGGVPALKAPNMDWGNYASVKSYLKLTN